MLDAALIPGSHLAVLQRAKSLTYNLGIWSIQTLFEYGESDLQLSSITPTTRTVISLPEHALSDPVVRLDSQLSPLCDHTSRLWVVFLSRFSSQSWSFIQKYRVSHLEPSLVSLALVSTWELREGMEHVTRDGMNISYAGYIRVLDQLRSLAGEKVLTLPDYEYCAHMSPYGAVAYLAWENIIVIYYV